jgi:polysaccharide deacetylase 2 family uncharacterized protein YibQ
VDASSDDLTKPLGQKRPPQAHRRWSLSRATVWGAGGLLGALGLTVAVVALYGDSEGGRPVARAVIASAPVPPPVATKPPVSADRVGPQQEADDIERQSGVRVFRGTSTSPHAAIVVEVPSAPAAKAAPPPDLVETSRFGALPRTAPDGSRPIDAYARPARYLADGRPTLGRIAIVVGGLGLNRHATADAIARLPDAVSLGFAPYGAELPAESERARASGHEILLQVPMEPFDYPDSDPGPRTLTVGAKATENIENLRWALGRFTGYVAVMNYMGGKLTADEKALAPIVREIDERGLGLLDDGSSSRSRLGSLASGPRTARADYVVDAVPRADQIDKVLRQLETVALGSGRIAIGSATAFPVTIERIAAWAATLEAKGILLVPVSAALATRPSERAMR